MTTLCWVCGKPIHNARPGEHFHLECISCRRCGGTTIVWDTKAVPFWFRCVGCLHGWLVMPKAPDVVRPARLESEIIQFTTHVEIVTKGEEEDIKKEGSTDV